LLAKILQEADAVLAQAKLDEGELTAAADLHVGFFGP
jgi:hypothetical protein